MHAKCTWTCHKRHWARKCAGKMPGATAATNVLCKPAQSKCTWTCQKCHFVWKYTGKMPDASPGAIVLCEPAQSKWSWTCHKSHFARTFAREMPDAPPLVIVLCEPEQSKCTWTFHKSYFVLKFTGEIRKCRMRRVPPRLNTGSDLNCKKYELLSVATLFGEKSITHLNEPLFKIYSKYRRKLDLEAFPKIPMRNPIKP